MPDEVKLEPCPNPSCTSKFDPICYHAGGLLQVRCRCGTSGPFKHSEDDAVAAWNLLPRKTKWVDHNHKDRSTWPPRDAVVLIDRGDGMKWLGNSSGIGLAIINENGKSFTLFLDEEQKTRPIRWTPWPGEE